MELLRSNLSRVRIPEPTNRIYKHECCITFDTPVYYTLLPFFILICLPLIYNYSYRFCYCFHHDYHLLALLIIKVSCRVIISYCYLFFLPILGFMFSRSFWNNCDDVILIFSFDVVRLVLFVCLNCCPYLDWYRKMFVYVYQTSIEVTVLFCIV